MVIWYHRNAVLWYYSDIVVYSNIAVSKAGRALWTAVLPDFPRSSCDQAWAASETDRKVQGLGFRVQGLGSRI